MKKYLDSYVKVYDMLEKDICDRTVCELNDSDWNKHFYYDYIENVDKRLTLDREFDVSEGDNISTKSLIVDKIWESYHLYTQELDFSWFHSWEGFTYPRFNKYRESNVMELHCDHIKTVFDGERKGIPTMSALGLINDDFEGGEFVMFDDDIIDLKKGSIVVFPSNFLFPHKVLPITKGIRYSFISWAW